MELIKENFWTLFCLVIGAILTIIGTVRIFIDTGEFNKNLTKNTKTLISGQDSIQFSQIISAEVEARTEKLLLESKKLLKENKELDNLNHDILSENRLLSKENRNLVNQMKDIISEDVKFIETNPRVNRSTKKMYIEYLNNFMISLSDLRVSIRIMNPVKNNPIKISFIDNRNIKNARAYDNHAVFEYAVIPGRSTHSPIELDLNGFTKKSIVLASQIMLKNGVTHEERIYISDYTQEHLWEYMYFEYYKDNKPLENYKKTGAKFPKDLDGKPDLEIFN
ncbi:hypothetical protein D9V96_007750 [Zobellia laminariae]|uniref:hypothetical protein n=1 Tax=Zobellia laminariae TaxID=248906 RepID=UPI0012D920D8